MHGADFCHKLLIHSKAAGGIYDDHAEAFLLCPLNGALGNLHRVFLPFLRINRDVNSCSKNLQLLYGGRTEGVAGGKKNLHATFGLNVKCKFCGECGFTGTVETCNKNHCGVPLDIDVRSSAAHERGKFVVHYLHHHLAWIHGGENVGSNCLVLYGIAEVLGNLIADVGIKKGLADFLDGFRNIDLGYAAFALKYFKRPLQSFAKIFKHFPIFSKIHANLHKIVKNIRHKNTFHNFFQKFSFELCAKKSHENYSLFCTTALRLRNSMFGLRGPFCRRSAREPFLEYRQGFSHQGGSGDAGHQRLHPHRNLPRGRRPI